MSSTVRTIAADCTSGDGTVLRISTLGQTDDVALQFRIGPDSAEATAAVVYVSPDALSDLMVFLTREQELHDLEFEAPELEDDDEVDD